MHLISREWCSHRRWWILQAASANPLRAGFFVSGQSGQTISPWREAPFDFFCWHIQQPHSVREPLKRKLAARGERAPRAPSIVDGFSRLPWQGFVGGLVA